MFRILKIASLIKELQTLQDQSISFHRKNQITEINLDQIFVTKQDRMLFKGYTKVQDTLNETIEELDENIECFQKRIHSIQNMLHSTENSVESTEEQVSTD